MVKQKSPKLYIEMAEKIQKIANALGFLALQDALRKSKIIAPSCKKCVKL